MWFAMMHAFNSCTATTRPPPTPPLDWPTCWLSLTHPPPTPRRKSQGSGSQFRFESLRPRTRTLRTPLAASAQLLHKFSHLAACLPHVCAYGPCTCVCVCVCDGVSFCGFRERFMQLKEFRWRHDKAFIPRFLSFPPRCPFFEGYLRPY